MSKLLRGRGPGPRLPFPPPPPRSATGLARGVLIDVKLDPHPPLNSTAPKYFFWDASGAGPTLMRKYNIDPSTPA